MSVYENLKNLNLEIPKAPDPIGAYIAYKKTANLLFISGQISIDSNGKISKGKLGKDLTIDQGQAAAKLCAINIIAQVKKACNDKLESIASCIKLTGYVNSTNDFTINLKLSMLLLNLFLQYLVRTVNTQERQLAQTHCLLMRLLKLMLYSN